jgi:hypothetical protein
MRPRTIIAALILMTLVGATQQAPCAPPATPSSILHDVLEEVFHAHADPLEGVATLRQLVGGLTLDETLEVARQASGQERAPLLIAVVGPNLRHRVYADGEARRIVAVAGDPSEPERFRRFLLGVLLQVEEEVAIEDRLLIVNAGISTAFDMPVASTPLRAVAPIDEGAVASHGARLRHLASDPAEDPVLRSGAIIGIARIGFQPAAPDLLALLADEGARSDRHIARASCIALAELGIPEAIDPIGEVLEATEDPYVFASASCALGDFGTARSLRLLLDNAQRFGNGAAPAAIHRHRDLVLRLLRRPDSPHLGSAIRATRYLFEGPDVRECTQRLMELLPSLNDDRLIAAALDRLWERGSKQQCAEAITVLPRQHGYGASWDAVHRRSVAVALEVYPADVATGD